MESTNTGEQVIDDETADVGGSTEIEKLMESLEIEVSLFVPSSCDVFEVCVLFTDAEQSYDGQSVKNSVFGVGDGKKRVHFLVQ